jgi:hypothetical protein
MTALTERLQKWRAMTNATKEMLMENNNRENNLRAEYAKQSTRISENVSAALRND